MAGRAQLLMDCVSDMITHEGLEGMQKMVECGLKLHPYDKPLTVKGQLPSDTGGGELHAMYLILDCVSQVVLTQ